MPESPESSGSALAALFKGSRHPMLVIDARTTRFVDVNPAALRFYGYTRAEFLRMSLLDLRPGPGAAEARRAVRGLSRRGAPWLGPSRHRKKSGAMADVRVLSCPTKLAGRPAWLSTVLPQRVEAQASRVATHPQLFDTGTLPVLFKRNPQPLWVYDRDTLRFLAVNDAALRLYGYSLAELRRRTLPQLLAPEERARFAALFKRRKGRGPFQYEIRHLRKGGAPLHVDVRSLDVVFAGAPARLAMLTDVSARRRLTEELGASEDRFQRLYSRTPAIMHSIDREGRLVSVSDLWLSTLGYRREEVLGRRSTEFLTPASRRFAREKVLPAFYKTGVTREAPYQMVKRNGEVIDVLLSASSERDARGRVARSFAVITDVTQRRREQEQLARATAWFESMFESSPDGIVSTDARGRFLRVNKAFERLTGYSQKELLRRTFQDITPPEYFDVGDRAIRRMAAGGDAATHVKEYRRKDGVRVPVHITGFAVKDKAGKILGFAVIVADMTEPHRLEKEIAETSAREQAKIGRDLHDSVGQTLTAVSLGLKSLQRLLPPGGRGRREAARLEALARLSIQQVRDVARGLLPHELQAGDLGASLRTLSHGAREMFGVPCQVSVRGDTRLSDNSAAVQLYRVAQEALNNAARHARARTGVRISLDAGARKVRLIVRDDGVGLPSRRPAGARGLGIEIMKHRAESLGGTLAVRRAPGGGTEVVCECPRPGSRA